jgi:hypothetical protein
MTMAAISVSRRSDQEGGSDIEVDLSGCDPQSTSFRQFLAYQYTGCCGGHGVCLSDRCRDPERTPARRPLK